MIECKICKKYKSEGKFREGYSICSECKDTPEAEEYRKVRDKIADEQYQKEIEYEREKEKRIKNQDYEGQYDWM